MKNFLEGQIMLLRILYSIGLTNLSEEEVSKYYRNRHFAKIYNGTRDLYHCHYNTAINVFEYNENIDIFIQDCKHLLNSIYNEEIKSHGLTEEETENALNNKNLVLRLVTRIDQPAGKAFYKEVDQKALLEEMHRTKILFYLFSTIKGNLIAIKSADIISYETNFHSITMRSSGQAAL